MLVKILSAVVPVLLAIGGIVCMFMGKRKYNKTLEFVGLILILLTAVLVVFVLF